MLTLPVRRRRGTLALRWASALAVPVLVFVGLWSARVVRRYETFGLRRDLAFFEGRFLDRVGRMELDHLLREAALRVRRPFAEPSPLPRLQLLVAEQDLATLDRDIPHSARDYVRGFLRYPDGEWREIELKYRGDYWWHWGMFKKSLRVKTKKKDLFTGLRSFNLIAPKFRSQLNNYLAYRLAERLRLMAPRTDLVNVELNGDELGLHLFVEQVEESTLRRHDRMPGDVYQGELVGRDRISGMRSDLFLNPRAWQKIAVNGHYAEDAYAPLEALSEQVFPPLGLGARRDLAQWLDPALWGRLMAYEVLTQGFHLDEVHNWRLYFDPARSRFEPIIWDPNGWHPQWLPPPGGTSRLDVLPSSLHRALAADARFLVARQEALEAFFRDGLDETFLAEVDAVIPRAAKALESDPAIAESYQVVSPRQAREAMLTLRAAIEKTFRDTRRGYLAAGPEAGWAPSPASPTALSLTVASRRPPAAVEIEYDTAVAGPVSASVGFSVDGEPRRVDVSGAATVRGPVVTLDVRFLPHFVPVLLEGLAQPLAASLEVRPATYTLFLAGVPESSRVRSVEESDASGERRLIVPGAPTPATDFAGADVVVAARPTARPLEWSGLRRVEGVERISDDLLIRPGTTVSLAAGATLLVEGRLLALGTGERPIRFVPAEEGQEPWGAIVLRGRGADGSRLAHVEVSGGSGYRIPTAEYSAMLSIHDVHGVVIENARFSDNRIVDDMVHTVYSELEIRDSTFERSLFDAVDLDITQAVVAGNRFVGSGNDALDLMTSEVVALDNHIEGSADKGISVGEATRLVALHNQIVGCAIGVESKDGSQALLFNNSLRGNALALHAYHKNWRYDGGGSLYFAYGDVGGGGRVAEAEKRSQIRLASSTIDGAVEPSTRLSTAAAADLRDLAVPELAAELMALVDPQRRGARPRPAAPQLAP